MLVNAPVNVVVAAAVASTPAPAAAASGAAAPTAAAPSTIPSVAPAIFLVFFKFLAASVTSSPTSDAFFNTSSVSSAPLINLYTDLSIFLKLPKIPSDLMSPNLLPKEPNDSLIFIGIPLADFKPFCNFVPKPSLTKDFNESIALLTLDF